MVASFILSSKPEISILLRDKSSFAPYPISFPDLFFNEHSEIILEGRYDSNRNFQSNNIIVKCPSKYSSIEEQEI